ncbi:MAG: SAM-dependent chlorinase/fluorinase [Aquificaceae bacterium]
MLIALMTDFSSKDGYVGAVKAVILSINPLAKIVDITHEIEPFNIKEGAFLLWAHLNYFPENSIFMTVVDPGVGTSRRPICVSCGNYTFVAPDNGLIDSAVDSLGLNFDAYLIERFKPASNTFHARDIFAKAAAYLSLGQSPSSLGSKIEWKPSFKLPKPYIDGKTLIGEVVYFDRFGNCITNIPCGNYSGGIFRNMRLKFVQNYKSSLEPALICSSFNLVELFIYAKSAKEELDVKLGEKIQVF